MIAVTAIFGTGVAMATLILLLGLVILWTLNIIPKFQNMFIARESCRNLFEATFANSCCHSNTFPVFFLLFICWVPCIRIYLLQGELEK